MSKSLLICLMVLSISGFLRAQNFEVSPMELFFNAEPGGSQTKYLRVKNHSSKIESYILKLSDYSIDSKGQGTFEDAGSIKYSIADWITIAPSFFELQPNEEKEIAVTINQPVDQLGSKWGVIFIGTAQEQTAYTADKQVSAGVMLSGRIAVKVFQTPGTNRTFKATISNMNEITATGDSLRTFSAIVNNLEEIITPCKVHLIATNIATGEESEFKAMEFEMYPKSSRKIELYLEPVLSKGTYSLAAILDYGSKTNLEGTQMVIKVE